MVDYMYRSEPPDYEPEPEIEEFDPETYNSEKQRLTNNPNLAGKTDEDGRKYVYLGQMVEPVLPSTENRLEVAFPEGGGYSGSKEGLGAALSFMKRKEDTYAQFGPEPGTETSTQKPSSKTSGNTAEEIIQKHEQADPTKTWDEYYQDDIKQFGLPDLSKQPHKYDRDKFEQSYFKTQSNPFNVNPSEMIDKLTNENEANLFREFFRGTTPSVSWYDRDKMLPSQKKEWDVALLTWRAKVYNQLETQRKIGIDVYNKTMNRFDNEKKEYEASIARYRTQRTKDEAEKKTIYNEKTGQHMKVESDAADEIVNKLGKDGWKYGAGGTDKKVWIHHPTFKIKLQVTSERYEELKKKGWKSEKDELKGGFKVGQEYGTRTMTPQAALKRRSGIMKLIAALNKGGGIEEVMIQNMIKEEKDPGKKAALTAYLKEGKMNPEDKEALIEQYKLELSYVDKFIPEDQRSKKEPKELEPKESSKWVVINIPEDPKAKPGDMRKVTSKKRGKEVIATLGEDRKWRIPQ